MIYFKTLNGKAIRYHNKLNVKKVYDHEYPEWFKKYYPDENVCVAVCVCIGKRPIWSVGSYAERWNTFVPDNYDKLPISEQRKIFDIRNMFATECHNMGYIIAKTANTNNDL